MTFVQRKINVSFSYGQGATGESGLTNTKLQGLRTSVKVIKAGDGAMGSASIQIYGVPLSLMNQLSVVGLQATMLKNNSVLVEAGDEVNGMAEVFRGTITYAWPDMQNAPQTVFRIEAQAGAFNQVKPSDPTAFSGTVEVATVAKQLAGKMGLVFENNGIVGKISNPYFYGSARSQMLALAKAARFAWSDDDQKTLAIWPMDKGRTTSAGSLVFAPPPDGIMVGYPIGTPTGILVKGEFSRPVAFGSKITVKSQLTSANGEWNITRLEYSLEQEMPHGEWFIIAEASKFQAGQEGPQIAQ
jgi:hypothetical protein